MRPVYILGTGHTSFGKSVASIEELMTQAVKECLEDAGLPYPSCDMAVIGNFSSQFAHQNHLGAVLNHQMNGNIEAIRVEAACAAGAVAIREAILALLSGLYHRVLVVGVEKMTAVSSQQANDILINSAAKMEQQYGNTFAGQFALIARAYLTRHQATSRDLARIAVINHNNALNNPLAQFHKKVSINGVLQSPLIADPLRLFDCAPLSDGAAAILLASKPAVKANRPSVKIAGFGFATGSISLLDRLHLDQFPVARQAAQKAYSQAAITSDQIDLAEIHDAFTITELILLEELGFAAPGKAYQLVRSGAIKANGKIPVNLSGGLKAKGHPVGATGVAQVVEITRQLQGQAGQYQLNPRPEIGLTCNLGGIASTAAVTILRRQSI